MFSHFKVWNTITSIHHVDILTHFFLGTLAFALMFAITGEAVLCNSSFLSYTICNYEISVPHSSLLNIEEFRKGLLGNSRPSQFYLPLWFSSWFSFNLSSLCVTCCWADFPVVLSETEPLLSHVCACVCKFVIYANSPTFPHPFPLIVIFIILILMIRRYGST